MTIIPGNDTMIFSDFNGTRKVFAALGVKLPRNTKDWKPVMYLAHPDLTLSEANSIKFELVRHTWLRQGRDRYYRFTAYNNEKRHLWIDLFNRNGIPVFTSA